jgi:hypothetical protein
MESTVFVGICTTVKDVSKGYTSCNTNIPDSDIFINLFAYILRPVSSSTILSR